MSGKKSKKTGEIGFTFTIPKKFPKIRSEIILLFILVLGLYLRLHYFIGFVNLDPQDDGIYLGKVRSAINGRYFDFSWARQKIVENDVVNPADQFGFRWMMVIPSFIFGKIFGVSDQSMTLYPMLCSLCGIIAIFYLGRYLFNERAGLISALLLSFFPLDVIYASRITPDVPMAFFMALSTLLFIIADGQGKSRQAKIMFLLAGLSLGLGYLTKVTAVSLLPVILAYVVFKRRLKREHLLFLVGFLIIIAAEGTYYYFETGDFFLHAHMSSKVIKFKYEVEGMHRRMQNTSVMGVINFEYSPKEFEMYPKMLLNQKPGWRTKVTWGTAYFYHIVIASIILLAILCVLRKAPKNTWIPVTWALLLFLFFQFGPMRVEFNSNNHLINYLVIVKIPRYLTVLTIPSILIIGALLSIENKIMKWIITPIVILTLFSTSILAISSIHENFTSKVYGIRQAHELINQLHPQKRVYSDYITLGFLRYYAGFDMQKKLTSFGKFKTPGEFKPDSLVVVGGYRGAISCRHIAEKLSPGFLKNPPEEWILLKDIPSKYDSCNENGWNTKIYYIPEK